jgi:peptide/nickel transport system ATP-binding protein
VKNRVLDINNLSFSYKKDKYIFSNFSFSLDIGQVVSIVGESGSGKSTLFNLIANELKPNSGQIVATKSISQVYQDPYSSFHSSYSIINQIKDVANIEKIDSYLSILNINMELLLKKPYELSGGQLQRASILRALLMRPKLLLIDEPTSALDNVTSLEVMRLLMSFLDDFAILLITHDNALAKWCSDNIINIGELS